MYDNPTRLGEVQRKEKLSKIEKFTQKQSKQRRSNLIWIFQNLLNFITPIILQL